MMFIKKISLAMIFVLAAFSVSANPQVVVTIKPLYTVAAWMMKGVGTPELLMKEKASPHHFHLLPSHIEKLHSTDLFLWVGPEMETEFAKLASGLDARKVITAMDSKGVKTLGFRSGGCSICQGAKHHEEGMWYSIKRSILSFFGSIKGFFCGTPVEHKHAGHHHHHHHETGRDPHIWTDPDNMLAIADTLKNRLISIDEQHSEVYKQNYLSFAARIAELKIKMAGKLMLFKDKPFVVFHDSLQYLEKYAGLNSGYVVKGGDVVGFSLKEIMKLKERLKLAAKNCILIDEELAITKIIEMVGDRQGLTVKMISPEGINLDVSEDIYFQIMDDLVAKIHECLS